MSDCLSQDTTTNALACPIQQKLNHESAMESSSRAVAGLLEDFPVDLPLAMELGVYRAALVPEIAEIFVASGGYEAKKGARHASALTMVTVLMEQGWESAESQKLLKLSMRMHEQYRVPDEYMLYAFSLLVAEPIRWCDQYGYRVITPSEQRSLAHFWTQIAVAQELSQPPQTLEAWLAFERDFEAHWQNCSRAVPTASRTIADLGREIFASRFWAPLRPLSRAFFTAMLDRDLCQAIDFRQPSWIATRMSRGIFALRKQLLRLLPSLRGFGGFLLSTQVCPFTAMQSKSR